jgi:hypothetical protein
VKAGIPKGRRNENRQKLAFPSGSLAMTLAVKPSGDSCRGVFFIISVRSRNRANFSSSSVNMIRKISFNMIYNFTR